MPPPSWRPTTTAVDAPSLEKALALKRVTVVHFWVAWCGNDRQMDDVIRNVRPDYEGRVNFLSMDSEATGNWTVALEAKVTNWPALVCYVDGRRVDTLVGSQSRNDVRAWINRHLAALSLK